MGEPLAMPSGWRSGPTPWKVKFLHEVDAIRHIERMRERGHVGSPRGPRPLQKVHTTRAYPCDCGLYHVSSKPLRKPATREGKTLTSVSSSADTRQHVLATGPEWKGHGGGSDQDGYWVIKVGPSEREVRVQCWDREHDVDSFRLAEQIAEAVR